MKRLTKIKQVIMRLRGRSKFSRCAECGYRVRGLNHENGAHHNRRTVNHAAK